MPHQMNRQIKILKVERRMAPRWDDYVLSHPAATHCHLYAWKNIIAEAYGKEGHYFYALQDDRIVGVLPVIHINSHIFSSCLISMPYLSYGGVLADSNEAEELLIATAIKHAETLRVKTVELRSLAGTPAVENGDELTPKVRMLKKLPPSSEELMQSFSSKLRNKVKRSSKEGMTFGIGGIELLDKFYNVFKINMRDLGSPVHKKQFFESLFSHMSDRVKIGVVEYKNIPVASGIIISFNHEVEIPWSSSLRAYNRFYPNMLLHCSLLQYCCNEGIKTFDFGRSTPDEGTYHFKKQWGSNPELLHWQEYLIDATGRHSESQAVCVRKRSNVMKMLVSLWKKLPVTMATRIGPLVRGNISN